MPIAWSPRACPGPDPPPSPAFQAASLVFFLLPVVAVPVGWALLFALRAEPRLKIRSLPANVLLGVGFVLCGLETGFRRTSFMISSPCWLQALFTLSLVATVSCAGVIRLFAAHSIKMRMHLKTTLGAINFDADAPLLSATFSYQNMNKPNGASPQTGVFSDIIYLILFGTTRGDPYWLLLVFESSTRPRNLVMIFFLLFIPAMLTFAILASVVPIYSLGCTSGCQSWNFELYCAVWVTQMFYGALIFPGAIRLFNDDDATGTFFELKISTLALPFAFLGMVLIPLDPNNSNANGDFNWEWFLFALTFVIWFIWTPLQIMHVLRERYVAFSSRNGNERTKSVVDYASGFTLEKILLEDDIYREFLNFCEQHLQVENCRFIRDVAVWKSVYFSRTHEFRTLRAKSIAKLYLTSKGTLEINVSAPVKEAILDKLASSDVHVELFDKALLEVSDLIRFTVWVEFENEVLSKRRVPMTAGQKLLSLMSRRTSSEADASLSPTP